MDRLQHILRELVEELAVSDIHRETFEVEHPDYGRWQVDVRHSSPGRLDPGGDDPDRLDIE